MSPKWRDIEDAVKADRTVKRIKCRKCGVIGEVTYYRLFKDGCCSACRKWQIQ